MREANCGICGRTIKDPVSIERGIGPICYVEKIAGFSIMSAEEYIPFPLSRGVKLAYHDGTQKTNVPHLVTHHSPDGFSYGYAGSGPADLALNILEFYFKNAGYDDGVTQCWKGECFTISYKLHHPFKDYFLVALKQEDDYFIPVEKIKEWIFDNLWAN